MKRMDCTRLIMTVCVALMLAGTAIQAYVLPPDPENAALRYYQACLLYQNVDALPDGMLSDVASGDAPVNDEVRKYIRNSRAALDTIAEAAVMDKCDWGIQYSDGFNAQLPHLGQARQLSRLVMADARISAADGQAQAAVEKCLLVRLLARHVGDDMIISYLVSMAIDQMSGKCLMDLLGSDKLDEGTLDRIGKTLRAINDPPRSMVPPLKLERDIAMQSMTMENIDMLIQSVNPELTMAQAKQMVEKLGGEKFLASNRKYYSDYMDSLIAAVVSGGDYLAVHNKLKALEEKLEKDRDKPESKLANITVPALGKIYDHQIRSRTALNALLVGIDVLKTRARTGELPKKLPAGLAKDLFSGKDFKYERTDAGFMLRCQGKDPAKDTAESYEFKVNR